MSAKVFFRKICSSHLWLNIGGMIAVVILFLTLMAFAIDIYTRHGESIEVPNFVGHNINDAMHVAEEEGIEIIVNDSIYNPKYAAGRVMKQTPTPGSHVKSGHIIYVQINTLTIPVIELPDIINNSSSRAAVTKLKGLGVKLGDVEFVPGEKDLVIGMKVGNRSLKPGDKITIHDMLILQVGDGRLNGQEDLEVTNPIYVHKDMPVTDSEELDGDILIDESGDVEN